ESFGFGEETRQTVVAVLGQKAQQHGVEIGPQYPRRLGVRRQMVLSDVDICQASIRSRSKKLEIAVSNLDAPVARLARVDGGKIFRPIEDQQSIAYRTQVRPYRKKCCRKTRHVGTRPPMPPPALQPRRYRRQNIGAVRRATDQRTVAEIGDHGAV